MVIAVIGAGYVGLVTAACLANQGNRVILVDIDLKKIEALRRGESLIYEPGLDQLLKRDEIEATADLEYALENSDISFICVGTPSDELVEIRQVVEGMGRALKPHHLAVVKSTVPPGTTQNILLPLMERQGKRFGSDFSVCVNPEFLREGSAVEDFLHPDRIIIGEANPRDGDTLAELYRDFGCPILRVDLKTAEMIKYASNAFLAMKVSFINEIGNICKELGIDAYEVANGMAYDARIGKGFLNAGIGFGGSCLPKDLKTLIAKSKEMGYEPSILEEAENLNELQPLRMVHLLKKHIPSLKGRRIGILGLAFKPNTDDIRDSGAIRITNALLAEGARVRAYDPKAMENFRRLFPQIEYSAADGVLDSEAILILTDWEEFEHLDYKGKVVIDGRRVEKAREARIYEGVCW